MTATDDLLRNNVSYAAGFDRSDLPRPPAKKIAVIACMDARLDVNRILGLEPGDAHVLRNAGGAVTDDTIRSLAVSQRLLGTEEIVVVRHTDCGMLGLDDSDLRAQIEKDTGVRPEWSAESFDDLDDGLRDSLARIAESPFIPHKQSVRGFVYDVETGRLREVV